MDFDSKTLLYIYIYSYAIYFLPISLLYYISMTFLIAIFAAVVICLSFLL